MLPTSCCEILRFASRTSSLYTKAAGLITSPSSNGVAFGRMKAGGALIKTRSNAYIALCNRESSPVPDEFVRTSMFSDEICTCELRSRFWRKVREAGLNSAQCRVPSTCRASLMLYPLAFSSSQYLPRNHLRVCRFLGLTCIIAVEARTVRFCRLRVTGSYLKGV